MNNKRIYVLGGHQTDFAQNWAREAHSIQNRFIDTVQQGLSQAGLEAKDVEVGHVGNFVSSRFTGQSHLGGLFGHVHPDMAYLPASSHEAACASGSMALLAAMADLEAGRYDLACVVGIEMMRNLDPKQGAENLRGAAWIEREWNYTSFVWPCAFSDLIGLYQERYGIDKRHLAAISQKNFQQAKRNPNAQCRQWSFEQDSFSENDRVNPTIVGHVRRQDCGQITDGAAVVFLATHSKAMDYARKRGLRLEDIPYIKGWGHVNAPMLFDEKVKLGAGREHLFPHLSELFRQTLSRAGLTDIKQVDGLEVHDCFSITEYMILDHCGWLPAGQAWQAIESDQTSYRGPLPINMSGGLIGAGHPVGATGVRMVLDCYKQTAGLAGDYQINNANTMMTVNLGGSTTTCASFVVGT